ncbi:MAG: hypothetical protein ACQCN4_09235 [Candidatus Bathyarchaeia archaeon]
MGWIAREQLSIPFLSFLILIDYWRITRRRRRMHETFVSFLQELEDSRVTCSGKEFLEKEVLSVLRKEGFSDEEIYKMPLDKLLDLFYDACLWESRRILSQKKPTPY